MAAVAAFGVAFAQGASTVQNEQPSDGVRADPYLWLEGVHDAKSLAWVEEQNTRTRAVLQADPQYPKDYAAILRVLDATDRIPYGTLEHEYVFNFWQDAEHPKGLWRRTSVLDYATTEPHWELLLDLDKLAAAEHENWVWEGADCSPTLKRCLLSLSRGGGDATVVREFDLASRSFVQDGFGLAEAKSNITYLDEDTVLFGTDFGADSMTESGYPRVVKLWKRGQPMTQARTLFEAKIADVGAQAAVFHGAQGSVAIIERTVTFFTTEYQLLQPDGSLRALPVPLGADLKGVLDHRLLFTLREDWSPAGAPSIAKGSLIAYQLGPDALPAPGKGLSVLFTPDAKSSIDEVAVGRDAVFASIYLDVTGSVHAFRPTAEGRWSDSVLPLPAGGSTHVVSANAFGPQALLRFEGFTTPTTLYQYGGDGTPVAIKSLPPRFDASNLATEQFFATSKDGTRVPYFVTRAKGASRPGTHGAVWVRWL